MKNKIIYSFCGCFMTGAAVAGIPLWYNTDGTCGGDICINQPADGACCATGDRVVKVKNVTADSASKVLDGLYIGPVKLFDDEGYARTLDSLDTEEITSVKSAIAAASSDGATLQLTKKQYNTGTVFITQTGGDEITPLFEESNNPPKGGSTCNYIEIQLHPCTKYTPNHEGETSDSPTVCQPSNYTTIYYKTGDGYFSDPDLAENHRYRDATHLSAPNTLEAPQYAGYTFRGWFPTWWASSVTDRSSYIGNVTPYRTVGYAFHIPWKNNNRDNGLYLRAPNWAYSGSNCKLNLFSGWAKNCEDTEYCEIEIAGYEPANELARRRCLDKPCDNICGQWLPGAVEYKLTNDCPTGTSMAEGSTSTFTLPYPHNSTTNSCTHTLNTYKLGCVSDTPQQPTKIRLQYHVDDLVVSGSTDECTIGASNSITIRNKTGSSSFSQTITAVSYTQNGSAVFNADQTVPCQIVTSGINGFISGVTNGDYYVVDLYPVSNPMVSIILDLKGGTLSGGGQNITVAKGEQLLPGVEPTRGDDAIFSGWYAKNASESTASKSVTIGDDVADGTTYVAKWDCDTANGFDKNLNGVCIQKEIQISEGGETITKPGVYIPKSGDDNNPKESITQEFMSHICKKFKIEFHGCFNGECPSGMSISSVAAPMYCDFTKGSGHYGCYKDSDYSQKVSYIDVPNAGDKWEFRGYYYGDASTGKIYDWGLTCRYICAYDHGQSTGGQAPSSQTDCNAIGGMWYWYCDHVGWHEPCNQDPDDPECVRLATRQQTWKGSPLDGFFPRYSGATTIPVGYGTPMNNIIHVVAPSCDNLTIHLYGAWAHKCEPSAHATCDMTIDRTWDANSMSGNHSKGDVSYTNGCEYGYDLDEPNQNIYNPTCSTPTVESVTVGFKTPTLSDGATCTLALQTFTCTPDGTIPLTAPDAPNCPSNYRFATWRTNNGATYNAGANIPCNSTTLGYNNVTDNGAEVSVTGIVCDCSSGTALPRGTGYDGCSTVCAGSTPPNNNFCQQITPGESQHITVMYNGSISGMCYYTVGCAQGYSTMPPANPTVTCANTQACTNIINGYQCTDGGNTGGGSGGNGGNTPDTCPSVPANWEPDGTLVYVSSGNNDCNYRLTCNKDFYATGGIDNNSNTITFGCDGTDCSTPWLMEARNTYHCQIQCPSASDLTVSHGNVTGGTVQGAYYQCTYTLGCENDYTLDGPNPYTCKRGACQQSTLQSYIDSHYTCTPPET